MHNKELNHLQSSLDITAVQETKKYEHVVTTQNFVREPKGDWLSIGEWYKNGTDTNRM
jgi:hypothetical protein